jgi:hypothetical protein
MEFWIYCRGQVHSFVESVEWPHGRGFIALTSLKFAGILVSGEW